tara:strand:+ start:280 stop:495 length:216 start_codon:yes stop_codon:yes gene_type:complete
MKRFVIVVWLVLIMIGLVSCKHIISEQQKTEEEPSDLRKQFELCKDKFYVAYPDEIILTEWHKCMKNKQEG